MPQDKSFSDFEEEIRNSGKRTNHILGIAINAYQHCPNLYNAVKDVQDFVALLQQKYYFEAENIHTLYNEKATKANIFKAFEQLSELTEDDNLIIYFSGHGEYKEFFKEGYWIPVEAHRNSVHEYISNSDIRNILGAIPTHHTFLIGDSCFSGSLFMENSKTVSDRLERDASRWGLTSGKNEIVSDGKIGENSPFAKSLLYQLQQATTALTVQQLCVGVTNTFINDGQTPLGESLNIKGHKNGQFVFRLKKDEVADWTATRQQHDIPTYQTFIKNYPNSPYNKTALLHIATLKEDALWKRATALDSLKSYLDYTDSYPNGRYTDKANQVIEQLEDKKDWTTAKRRHTISAYNQYKQKHPRGAYVTKANLRIQDLRKELELLPNEIGKIYPKNENKFSSANIKF